MDVRKALADCIVDLAAGEGLSTTCFPAVRCLKFSAPTPQRKGRWPRSMVIVAQGQKEIALEKSLYRYDEAHYIATPIDLPVTSRVRKASEETPYLGLLISLDVEMLSEVAAQLPADHFGKLATRSLGIFTGQADEKMLGAALRLAQVLQSPEDAPVLAPLALKEIYYHLLKSQNGRAIYQFARSGDKLQRISQVVQTMKADIARDFDVSHLAKLASMSRTSFFRCFREVTAMTPIQYQKSLRLIEARRLLIEEKESAERAGFLVGYKSSSQFSREFSRMFGNPPLRDSVRFKN